MDHIYFVWVASNRFEDGHAFDIEIDDLEATMTIICSVAHSRRMPRSIVGRLIGKGDNSLSIDHVHCTRKNGRWLASRFCTTAFLSSDVVLRGAQNTLATA
ncbi:MAG: hypothetical protein WA108_03390 [Thiobacillus sp.]|jgi:hypothetical protein